MEDDCIYSHLDESRKFVTKEIRFSCSYGACFSCIYETLGREDKNK